MPCILVIDENAEIREMYRYMLALRGYDVVEAGDGAEGLRCCQAHPIALVLTDLVMPGTDGLALVATLRTRMPAIKIIVMSGDSHLGGARCWPRPWSWAHTGCSRSR